MNIKTATHYYFKDITRYLLGGVVCALCLLWGGATWLELKLQTLGFYEYTLALGGGLFLGLSLKVGILFAFEIVMRANAASAHLNAKRAQALGERLKIESKEKIRIKVTEQARSIILQMHGEQDPTQLAAFFHYKMEEMAESIYLKIDRHLNYLTDRAVHGDIKSLKRLYELYRRSPEEREKEMNQLLERFMNEPSEHHKLKDKIDTLYDGWKFRYHARSYLSDELAL